MNQSISLPTSPLLHIEVAFADAARSVRQHCLELAAPITVAQAIALCPFADDPLIQQVLYAGTPSKVDNISSNTGEVKTPVASTLDVTMSRVIPASAVTQPAASMRSAEVAISIWGRKTTLTQLLRDRDRIEICRPLLVDPKVARRERFAQQGSKAAGLFARRRPGAKPGY